MVTGNLRVFSDVMLGGQPTNWIVMELYAYNIPHIAKKICCAKHDLLGCELLELTLDLTLRDIIESINDKNDEL